MPLPSTRRALSTIEGPFRILVVCTGNICRSPLAEASLRRHLAPLGGDLVVASAGTLGLVDQPMDAQAAAEARRLGLETDTHRGSWLRSDDIVAAHLVLTATGSHRAAVVDLVPDAIRRTFTLRELAAVLSSLARAEDEHLDRATPERLLALVDRAASVRGNVMSRRDVQLDVADPYRGSDDLHRDVADAIEAAAVTIAGSMLASGVEGDAR